MNFPDVVFLLADFLSQNDRARLAQVSRFHFQLVIPLAWRRVTGVTQLFRLLPRVRVETPGALSGTETIYLPRNLDALDFARFGFYAKFVEHLQLFNDPAVVIKLNRWNELLRYTSRYTLLPSLLSISLGTYWSQSISHYAWIAIFSSPSVRQVEMCPLIRRNLPTVSSETASAILNILIDRCPKMESLSIFVDPKQRTSPLETGFFSGGAHQQGTSEALGLLQATKQVRRLSCTSSIAGDCQNTLLLLSRIPNLEVLQMYASQQDDDSVLPLISLEPEAFSRLRCLTLCDFGPRAVLAIGNRLASIAELTELTLEINHNTSNRVEEYSTGSFYNTMLIPTICARMPRLTHLSVRPIRKDKSQVDIEYSALQLLASLHLTSLTFARSCTNVEYLVTFFPHIQTLRWPDQPITFDKLEQFAKNHQLKHISMKLDVSPAQKMETLRNQIVPPATPCVLESDYGDLAQLSHAETKHLFARLVRVWPRPLVLQQIVPFDYPHCDFAAKRYFEKLNKELKKIRQEVEVW